MTEKKKAKTAPKLNPTQWAKVGALYETGDYTAKQLAEEYGVSESSVQKKMKSMGFKKGAMLEKRKEEAGKKLMEEAFGDSEKLAKDIADAKKDYEVGQKFLKNVWKSAAKKVADGDELGAQLQMKTFSMLQQGLYALKLSDWEHLGLNKQEEEAQIEGFTVEDLTDEDIARLDEEALVNERMYGNANGASLDDEEVVEESV